MPKDKKSKKEIKEESGDDSSPDEAPVKDKRKNVFAMVGSDDDEDEDSEVEEVKPKQKKKESKSSKNKEDEDVSDDETAAMFGDKKKKKDKKEKDDDKKEKKDKKDKKEKKEKKEKKFPMIGEVLEVKAVPKKDKLKQCKVQAAAEDPITIVTSAPNIVSGKKYIIALPGLKMATGIEVEERPVGGINSAGMFCGPNELGWATDILDENEAIMVADSCEVGAMLCPYEEAVEAFQERKKAAEKEQEAAQASKGANKKGKKKGGKEDEEDLDGLLEEFGVEVKEAAPKKKGKKGKAADNKDDDDEAALKEFAPPERVEEPAAKSAGGKKKKGGKAAEDDDFDAILAAEGAKAPAVEEPAASSSAAAAAAKDDEEDEGEGEVSAKTLANRRKKEREREKKKAKQAAVGGGGFYGGGGNAEDEPADVGGKYEKEEEEQPSGSQAKGKAKGKAKAESAVARKAREQMEKMRAEREEREKFEAEQRRLIEEEEKRIREEEEALEAARAKKREARQAKIAQQKADGTYMTKADKARERRAAELRAQFGFSLGGGDDEDEEDKSKKKGGLVIPNKKKKKPQKNQETDESAPQAEQEQAPAPAAEVKQVEPKKPEPAEQEDDDGWEAVAEEMEKKEEEKAKKADEPDSDKDSDSSSDSGSDSDSDSDSSSDSFMGYRSPILVIMGHVDTGKTKLLDKIRRTNVQDNEAGGITQQIGATFFPDIALLEQTQKVDSKFEIEVPGMMVIDTPGHESFNNLRARGSSLCDMAILVIDIMHGLEPQTVESLEMLKKRQCFFIIALNKIDRCAQWDSKSYTSIKDAMSRQEESTLQEFRSRYQSVATQLNERGLNVALYWENEDPGSVVSIVPTSAMTGEGVPDLLYLALKSAQTIMPEKLEVEEELSCTVIEVKNIEGLGTTIDVILVNGTLREGDQIVIAGVNGAIVTNIRALLTPQPMKEIRVKNEYIKHKEISQSMGIKICAPGLEDAVAGAELIVVKEDDDIEELKEEVMEGFDSILQDFKSNEGVYVKASTLGSLEALLSFLRDMKIPVFDVGIGEVHKKDVKRACIMKEKKHPEYAVILAFDVKINQEARVQADRDDVQIMDADIIYNLKDKFEKYMEKVIESKKQERKAEAVFPCILQMEKQYIFNRQNPIIVGCKVLEGNLHVGTPLCVPDKDNLVIGRVGSIERDRKPTEVAKKGESVCVKIDQSATQNHIMYGRHFDFNNHLYSQITRQSIDVLKDLHRDKMKKSDWELIIGMKRLFDIQ